MARARYANVLQQLVVETDKQVGVNVVGLEGVGVLAEAHSLQPISHSAHAATSSSSDFASCSTGVPKPSVNQL